MERREYLSGIAGAIFIGQISHRGIAQSRQSESPPEVGELYVESSFDSAVSETTTTGITWDGSQLIVGKASSDEQGNNVYAYSKDGKVLDKWHVDADVPTSGTTIRGITNTGGTLVYAVAEANSGFSSPEFYLIEGSSDDRRISEITDVAPGITGLTYDTDTNSVCASTYENGNQVVRFSNLQMRDKVFNYLSFGISYHDGQFYCNGEKFDILNESGEVQKRYNTSNLDGWSNARFTHIDGELWATFGRTIAKLGLNHPPSVLMQISPEPLIAEEPVTLTADVSDPDENIENTNWNIEQPAGNGGFIASNGMSGRTVEGSFTGGANYDIRVTVTDKQGMTATSSQTVTVRDEDFNEESDGEKSDTTDSSDSIPWFSGGGALAALGTGYLLRRRLRNKKDGA